MDKIRVGDTVQVIKGKDRGKKGKVLRINAQAGRASVEGINLLKHFRRRSQQDQQGGVVSVEGLMNKANLMLVCKNCSRPARVGFKLLQDGTKSRICKSCKEVI
ncbi:50S ribosomal protein L24 [bacterium]|nr:MAG: 50S ribosomal protein L24 [bacterium]